MALISHTFDFGMEGWRTYDYEADRDRVGHAFPRVSWAPRGGVGDTGYVWTDDHRWSIDTPETPHSILAFLYYRSWEGLGAVDLRDATVSFHLRGDALERQGAAVYFWILTESEGNKSRWHLTSCPLLVHDGSWGEEQTLRLTTDPSAWHNSWHAHSMRPTLHDALRECDSYGFAFVGFRGLVTGRLAMDELRIRPSLALD